MFRMLIHPSSGACDLFVELFHGLYCSGSMCVGVTLWFSCGAVVSVCRLRHCWCYVVVWLWWCGICIQAEALVDGYTASVGLFRGHSTVHAGKEVKGRSI